MNTDININELFSEKNQSIFLNKLLLDLENNTDTLSRSTKNIVLMEISKLLSSLKRIYSKYSINIEDVKIKELLNETKTNFLSEIGILIKEKSTTNRKYIENNQNGVINKSYLKNYHRSIDSSEQSFEENVSLGIREVSEVKLFKSLLVLYPCANEDMHNELLNIINIEFTDNLISRVIKESSFRSQTLKNISVETYRKYLDLSKGSNGLSNRNSKVKRKEGN